MKGLKKVLTVVILLCFAITLMPLVAFAKDIDYQQCEVFMDDTSARTDEDVAVIFNFDGQLNTGVTTTDVYVWFVKEDMNVPNLSVKSSDNFDKSDIGVFKIPANRVAEGREYYFQFASAGNYTVHAALDNPADVSGSTSQKISNVERQLSSSGGDIGVDTSSSTSKYRIVINGREYENGSAISLSGLLANNIDQEIKMKVIDANGRAVNKVRVRVDANSDNLSFDKTSAVTDQLGQVTFKVSTGRTGDYKIYVTCSNAQGSDDTQTPDADVNTAKKVVMNIGSNDFTVNNAKKTLDVVPVVKENRTFVPYRALSEAFGAEVTYNQATQTITTKLNNTTVVMTIGSTSYTVNGVKKTVDVAPYIVADRTMVPIRFIAEAFGSTVTPSYDKNGTTTSIIFTL